MGKPVRVLKTPAPGSFSDRFPWVDSSRDSCPGGLVGKLWRTHRRAFLPEGLRELGSHAAPGQSVPQHPGLSHTGGQSRLPGARGSPAGAEVVKPR